MQQYAVYIMASQKNGTLYIGVANDIAQRALDHREGRGSKFTQRYNIKRLVYMELFDRIEEAIDREKQLKK